MYNASDHTRQVREKLHVILCFSPMAPEFRNRARKFPALVSCTVIDWFQPWPKEALASVGTRFLSKSCYLDGEGIRAGVEQFMMKSFEGVNAMCTKVGPIAWGAFRDHCTPLLRVAPWFRDSFGSGTICC